MWGCRTEHLRWRSTAWGLHKGACSHHSCFHCTHTGLNTQLWRVPPPEDHRWHRNQTLRWCSPQQKKPGPVSPPWHPRERERVSRLHLLRRLKFFGVSRALLRTSYDTVVASAVFDATVCWGREAAQTETGGSLASWLGELALFWAAAWTLLRRWRTAGRWPGSHPSGGTPPNLCTTLWRFPRQLLQHPQCSKEHLHHVQ